MALLNRLFQKRTSEFEKVKKDLVKNLDETIQMCDDAIVINEQVKQQLLANLDKINSVL